MIKKLIFMTAKKQFQQAFRKHKSQVRRAKREAKRGINIPVEPYGLKKRAIKRQIRETKFMDKAAYLAAPKTKSVPRGGNPRLVGKAYASDKRAKRTMNISLPKKQREAIQEGISQSVRRFLKDKIGRKMRGGVIKAMRGRFV